MSPIQEKQFNLSSISKKFTEETLRLILNKALGRDDCLLDRWIIVGDACNKGDGYLSEVVRMKVYAKCPVSKVEEQHSVDLIIKSLPSNIGRRKSFRSTDFFRNEIAFYEHVLPAFEKLQKRNQVNYNLFPRCYAWFCDGEEDFLALEDLSPDGYASPVRQEGLNNLQCRLVMLTLAQFHALSYALKDQDLGVYQNITGKLEETYFDEKFRVWVQDFHKDQRACMLDAMEKELPSTIYQEKIYEFTNEHFFANMIKMATTKGQYSVINHGDSWTPNFLMKYASENIQKDVPKHVKLIDFQLVRDASPILDLMFFFYSGTTEDLRKYHFKDLIQYYYDSLCYSIKELGADPEKMYPKNAFHDELKIYSKFGLGFSLESVPFTLMKNDDAPDLDMIESDDAVPITTVWKVRPIAHKEGRLRLVDNVRHAVDNGYL